MPIPLQPVESGYEDAKAIAAHLATPAAETSGGDLLHSTIDDDKELLKQAIAIREQLDHELRQQAASIGTARKDGYSHWSALSYALQRARKGEWSWLRRCGLEVNPGWLNDITRSMLRNRPVEVEIAQTHRPHVDRTTDGHYALEYGDMFKHQSVGVEFAAMLRRIQGFDYTRPVVKVDDLLFSTEHFAVSALHRHNALQAAHHSLQVNGAIGADDQPGRDFVFVPQTRSVEHIDELMEKLRQSEKGIIVPYKDGRIYLRPRDRIYESTARQHAAVDSRLSHEGVLLQTADGTPTDIARDAAGFLDPVNTKFTHIRLYDTPLQDQVGLNRKLPEKHQALSILLQSLDIAYPDRDHNIYYDHRLMPPKEAVFALTSLLYDEIDKVITSLGELDDVRQVMKPKDYFNHNYNPEDETWPEDIQGAHVKGVNCRYTIVQER
jgi:hypothetical protein